MRIYKTLLAQLKKTKLRNILILVSVLVTVIFLIAESLVLFSFSTNLVEDKMQNINEGILSKVDVTLTSAVNEISEFTGDLSQNGMLLQKLLEYQSIEGSIYDQFRSKNEIQNILNHAKYFYTEIETIDVYTKYGVFSSTNQNVQIDYKDLMKSSAIRKIVQTQAKSVIIEPYYNNIHNSSINGSIRFGSAIRNGDAFEGVIVVQMRKNWFERLLDKDIQAFITADTSAGSKIVWTNDNSDAALNGLLLSSLKSSETSTEIKMDQGVYKVIWKKNQQLQWKVAVHYKITEFFEPLYKIRRFTYLITALCVVFVVILSEFLSGIVTKPLNYVIQHSDKFLVKDELTEIKRKFGKKSFREQMMYYFIGIIAVPLTTFMIIYYFATAGVLKDTMQQMLKMSFGQTLNNMEYFSEITNRITLKLATDLNIQDFLYTSKKTPNDFSVEKYNQLKKIVDTNQAIINVDSKVGIFGTDGKVLYSSASDVEDLPANSLRMVGGLWGQYTLWDYQYDYYKNEYSVSYIRKVRQTGTLIPKTVPRNDEIGFIAITYREKDIDALYANHEMKEESFNICSSDGKILLSTDKSNIGNSFEIPIDVLSKKAKLVLADVINEGSREEALLLYATSPDIPWILTGRVQRNELTQDNNSLIMVNLVSFLIATTIGLLVAYMISNKFNKSIGLLNGHLISYADKGGEPEFDKGIGMNEIANLAGTFNQMAKKIKSLIHEIYDARMREMELENEKKDAELMALYAQINPHFLYNTLESTKWIIKSGQMEKAFDMIDYLGDLFRFGAGKEKELVTVAEEIEYVKSYVRIQKVRFSDRLECTWNIDDDILDCMILKFLLQPLVENSINHGMHPDIPVLIIKIEAHAGNDNTIILKVTDNGRGISNEKKKEILRKLSGEGTSKSIGLYNVHRRIRLYFGEAYGICLNTALEKGIEITVKLPRSQNLFVI